MATRQLVVLIVDEEEFGLDIDRINSIEKMLEIFKTPNAPKYIEGMVNLRGSVHTVFNLRKRFDMECPEFDDDTKIIMVNTAHAIVGIIVDNVKEIIKVEDVDYKATPSAPQDTKGKYLNGAVRIDNRIIKLLDWEKVLTVDEIKQSVS